MKFSYLLITVSLIALVTAKKVPPSRLLAPVNVPVRDTVVNANDPYNKTSAKDNNFTVSAYHALSHGGTSPNPSLPIKTFAITDAAWSKAVCAGRKQFSAMTHDSSQGTRFISPLTSPWDGDLEPSMIAWGWSEWSQEDAWCEFSEDGAGRALELMGISPLSTEEGGDNSCWTASHFDSPAVIGAQYPEREDSDEDMDDDDDDNDDENLTMGADDSSGDDDEDMEDDDDSDDSDDSSPIFPLVKEQYYLDPSGTKQRCTGAQFTFGVNIPAGVLYLVSRVSPFEGAKEVWEREPATSELPLLRASSDLAWGVWNKVMGAERVGEIKKIFSMYITNRQTQDLVLRALEMKGEVGGVKVWPGTDIDAGSEGGLAILGSPNGKGVGFFLAQHKKQLGSDKYVQKITAYTLDPREQDVGPPKMVLLFWIEDVPSPRPELNPDDGGKKDDSRAEKKRAGARVLSRSKDGKNMTREHLVWAKL